MIHAAVVHEASSDTSLCKLCHESSGCNEAAEIAMDLNAQEGRAAADSVRQSNDLQS